jgi:beta-mannanase
MRGYGAIPLYSWASEGTGEADEQPEFQLADIVAGDFDAYIRRWATEAKAWGHPFFLRFDWEMNGNWFPWSESVDGNHPGEFVAAWRHVHDIFTEVGATNAAWVWCPYVNPNGNLPGDAALYPGDGYVDWTCLDGYNRGTTASPTAPYRSFDFLFGPDYRAITGAIAPTKPMLLGEVATSENGGSKAEWIEDMFAALPTAYPQVRGLMWFDYYDQGNDWPIETSAAATAAFAGGISDPRYLANSFAGTGTGPVPLP